MARASNRLGTSVKTILVLLILAFACTVVPRAALAQDGWESLDFRTISDDCGPYSIGKYEARDSSISYCMNQERYGPSAPGGPWLTYSQGWVWLDDAYGAVVCNGYPAASSFGGHSFSPDRARAATQLAVWMLNGTTKTDGSYSYLSYDGKTHAGAFTSDSEVVAAARWLCESARSGAIKAAPHRARRYIGPISGTQRQDMLYVLPTVSVSFQKTSADAQLTAQNDNYRLAGARFDIYEQASDTRIVSITMDADGHASATLLPNTAYYLVETAAPTGYIARADRIPFSTSGSGGNVDIQEAPGSVSLTIVKRDAATGNTAQPGASLAGAEFSCTSLSTPGWTRTLTTDNAGRASLDSVPLGTFSIHETKAPEGYLPAKETWTYTVAADQLGKQGTVELECSVPNTPIAFDLEISKFKDAGGDASGLEQPAGGVRFEIISNTTHEVVGSITTNVYGFASTSDSADAWYGCGTRPAGASGAIPYDRAGYTIHEVESTVPVGFSHVGDWTIDAQQLADGARLQYIVDNHALLTHLQIVKCDTSTGQTVPLAGFTFKLLDSNRNPISQTCWYPNHSSMDTFTTDSTGTVTLPESLMPGTYYIHEDRAAEPYLLSEDLEIEIPADPELSPVVIVPFYDRRATGAVTISKTDAQDESALAGATFDIRAAETIVEPNGSIAAVAGETVATVSTQDDGIATAKDLSLGMGSASYEAIEVAAPEGYLLDSSPHPFTLSYQDSSTEVVLHELDLVNDYTKLDLSKTDITGMSELEGAKLELLNAQGTVVDQWVSNGTPHRIDHLEPGAYTLRELCSPRMYDVAEDVDFELKPTGEVQTVQMKDSPLKIDGQIDKRQEIAQPLNGLTANADGLNRSPTQTDGSGRYSYTLDFRNTSSTWVDECTVTDTLEAAVSGAAQLISITTPRPTGDRDGLMNVWYRTDQSEAATDDAPSKTDGTSPSDEDAGGSKSDDPDKSGTEKSTPPNATLDDGHSNVWLEQDEVLELLGSDARKLDYSGWRLWKADVPTSKATKLDVCDLNLKEGENVIGIRFEYGCVDKDFTTRTDESAWARKELKDEHDDVEDAAALSSNAAENTASGPAVITMQALDAYDESSPLINSAEIDLVRNGGGTDLEAHDSDRVIQRCAHAQDLPHTGSLPVAALMCSLITSGLAVFYLMAMRKH